MKREFIATYQSTINMIKQLKNSNDTLNRNIGIENLSLIYKKIKIQESIIQNIIKKIDEHIIKLEQTYLDPDTARKIGTAKQQYRIQKDRRKQLIQSINYDDENHESQHNNLKKKHQVQKYSSSILTNDSNQTNKESFGWNNRHNNKESQHTGSENSNFGVQHDQETNIQFEMERKILIQRNNEINHVTKSILNVQSIMNDTCQLVQEQGQKIDIIGEEIFTTYRNVHAARQNLAEANEYQKKSKKKYVLLSILLIIGIAIGAILLVA